jgi:integrase
VAPRNPEFWLRHSKSTRFHNFTPLSPPLHEFSGLGIAKTVLNFAIREYDLNLKNPFERLDIGTDQNRAIDLVLPLPREIILLMYRDLRNNQTLFDAWTLLHHTGAQSAEILGLHKNNLFLDGDLPYIEIKPEGLRTVKAKSRIRKIPLVGQALNVAKRLDNNTPQNEYVFPSYAETRKHDTFSATMMKRLRKFTDNPKHIVYSLRHRMKDELRECGAGLRVELAIIGHANEKSAADQYGSSVKLSEMRNALEKIDFDVPQN